MSDYRIKEHTVRIVNVPDEIIKKIRAEVIDDFVKEICKMIVQSENNGNCRFYAVEIKQAIADLAERLKEQKKWQENYY